MKKKILIFYYSQSGELYNAVNRIIPESVRKEYQIDYIKIEPFVHYKFPCSWQSFFSVFPDSVLQNTRPNKKINITPNSDDIILLCYQPWFVHPSIPFNSFLKSEYFSEIITNHKVVLFSCCRNTWINSLNIVRTNILENKGVIISEIIIEDSAATDLKSAYNYIKWFFTGKKSPFNDLIDANKKNIENRLHKVLIENCAEKQINLKTHPRFAYEQKIVRYFTKWAKFITKSNNTTAKKIKLLLFQTWIVLALIFLAPIIKFLLIFKKNKYEK